MSDGLISVEAVWAPPLPLCDHWLTVTIRKPEAYLCPARVEWCTVAGRQLRPGQGVQLATAVLQAELEGGRGVSASLARWTPLLEALASGTRFSSGPVRVWCVLRRTSHPCH